MSGALHAYLGDLRSARLDDGRVDALVRLDPMTPTTLGPVMIVTLPDDQDLQHRLITACCKAMHATMTSETEE